MTRIVIFGSGVVGQATGKGLARKGHAITYVDINPQAIARMRAAGMKAMTAAEIVWDEVDLVMLAVPTPTLDDEPVMDYIDAAAQQVGSGLARANHFVTVVVRSTVPPTTTERRVTPILESRSGKWAGVDFGVAMNPEFLRQARSESDFARPRLIVLGTNDRRTAEILDALYAPFGAAIVHCTPTEAEMIKYVNNVYNAVKISFFNEVHAICLRLGIDSGAVTAAVARTAEAMWNPLYGTRGGQPYGGACLPKDTAAFMTFVRAQGWDHLLLEATLEVNRRFEAKTATVAAPARLEPALHAPAGGTKTRRAGIVKNQSGYRMRRH